MIEFLQMGGYAFFVWSAYGISLLAIACLTIQTNRSHKKMIQHLQQLHKK